MIHVLSVGFVDHFVLIRSFSGAFYVEILGGRDQDELRACLVGVGIEAISVFSGVVIKNYIIPRISII